MLDVPAGPARYYVLEITHSLEAGLLLASLELAASVTELLVRERLANHRAAHGDNGVPEVSWTQRKRDRIDLEYDRSLTLYPMLQELVGGDVISAEDAEAVRKFYKGIRIPLHHGLPARYVAGLDRDAREDPLGVLWAGGLHSFEEKLESYALDELRVVLNFLGN